MSRAATVGVLILSLAAVCVPSAAANVPGARDQGAVLQASTRWEGWIRQGTKVFPTTIVIRRRDQDRIGGEIDYRTDSGINKLVFQGNIIEGHAVAWITDKKEETFTFPGLYIGTIKGKTLSGIWQVPSAGQYDQFAVKLME